MTDPRILHAAARGARIQRLTMNGVWVKTGVLLSMLFEKRTIRVHPDDHHLMYGPISTALREAAEKDTWLGDEPAPYLSAQIQCYEFGAWTTDAETRRMFLLILAEALSYDGI